MPSSSHARPPCCSPPAHPRRLRSTRWCALHRRECRAARRQGDGDRDPAGHPSGLSRYPGHSRSPRQYAGAQRPWTLGQPSFARHHRPADRAPGPAPPDALVTDQPQTEAPSYRILINISRLDVTSDGVATLEADWQIVPRDRPCPRGATAPGSPPPDRLRLTRMSWRCRAVCWSGSPGAIDITGLR